MLALGAYFGGNEKNILVILVYLCSRPAQGGGAGLVTTKIKLRQNRKNILVILVYLCSRPAQGGGAGLVRYYTQNKTAPEPPLPYFGGSTSKKNCARTPITYTTWGVPGFLSVGVSQCFSQLGCASVSVSWGVPGFLSVGVSQGFCQLGCPSVSVSWGVLGSRKLQDTSLVAKSQIGIVIGPRPHTTKRSQPPLRLCALICCQQVQTVFYNTVAYIDIN